MDLNLFFYYVFSIYPLALIIFGTIGNLLSFLILIQKDLRSIPTFTFAAFITIADTFSLYIWNLNHYLQTFQNGINLEFLSVAACKITTFMQYSSLQYSSWLLTSLTVERYLSIRVKTWKTEYFNSNKAAVVAILLGVAIAIFNGHLLVANGFVEFDNNGTEIVHCYESQYYEIFPFWQTVHAFAYSFIPTVLVIVSNALLIHHIITGKNKIRTSTSTLGKQRELNKIVIIMTLLFSLLTLPAALVTLCLNSAVPDTTLGQLILNICDAVTFSYHSSNFLILFVSNKQFKRVLKSLTVKTMIEPKTTRTA